MEQELASTGGGNGDGPSSGGSSGGGKDTAVGGCRAKHITVDQAPVPISLRLTAPGAEAAASPQYAADLTDGALD